MPRTFQAHALAKCALRFGRGGYKPPDRVNLRLRAHQTINSVDQSLHTLFSFDRTVAQVRHGGGLAGHFRFKPGDPVDDSFLHTIDQRVESPLLSVGEPLFQFVFHFGKALANIFRHTNTEFGAEGFRCSLLFMGKLSRKKLLQSGLEDLQCGPVVNRVRIRLRRSRTERCQLYFHRRHPIKHGFQSVGGGLAGTVTFESFPIESAKSGTEDQSASYRNRYQIDEFSHGTAQAEL